MNLVLALTRNTGRHLAEIGFLLVLIAGIWPTKSTTPRRSPAGALDGTRLDSLAGSDIA
jgi:hypothetical protein